jgi:predicted nucleotidyltransferase component of viral defense system
MVNLSQRNIKAIADKTNFIKDTVEKVLRLVDILEYIAETPIKDKLVLKGGTAINLFYFGMPRLSVDIDFDYIGVEKEESQSDKAHIKDFLTKAMSTKGYALSPGTKEHYALDSFVFYYTNSVGNRDNIKIDINYLDRAHILEIQKTIFKNAVAETVIPIGVLDKHELFGSKIAALIDRCKPRDLYDVYGLIHSDIDFDRELLKKCAVFYNCVGGEANIDTTEFSLLDGINKMMITKTLKPVIAKTDRFDYGKAVVEVKAFLKDLCVFDECEERFIAEFRNRKYRPELLFSDEDILKRIKEHPMAIWRTMPK